MTQLSCCLANTPSSPPPKPRWQKLGSTYDLSPPFLFSFPRKKRRPLPPPAASTFAQKEEKKTEKAKNAAGKKKKGKGWKRGDPADEIAFGKEGREKGVNGRTGPESKWPA